MSTENKDYTLSDAGTTMTVNSSMMVDTLLIRKSEFPNLKHVEMSGASVRLLSTDFTTGLKINMYKSYIGILNIMDVKSIPNIYKSTLGVINVGSENWTYEIARMED